jgi:hypothetical protein
MAVVQYSIEEGVSRVLHTYLKPPPEMVPIGYAYLIQKHAEQVKEGYLHQTQISCRATG